MSVYELAEKYYPRLWSRERLEKLVEAGRLSREELERLVAGKEE